MLLNDYRIIRPKSTKIQRKGKAHYVYQVVGQTYNLIRSTLLINGFA